MLHDEIITNPFKAFSLCWCLGITGFLVNYTYDVDREYTFTTWQYFMIIQQIFSWLVILCYLLLWLLFTPSNDTIFCVKMVFLTISGPCLLSLSFYAFWKEEDLHLYIYGLSFLIWWLLFSVSVYSTFKISLEISLVLHRKLKKMKLKEHYRSINLRSLSSYSK